MTDRFLGAACPPDLLDAGERLSVDELRARQLEKLQSTVRTAYGITRATIEIQLRCRNALTRNRASPSTANEKSISWSRSNSTS